MVNYESIFAGRDPQAVTLLECQLTYTCNIRCDYCFNPHHLRGNELRPEEWRRVIDEARELGAAAAIFNGGEPFAYRGCVELIRYAHDLGLITGTSTNGILLKPDTTRALAGNLDVLQISLHPWRYENDIAGGIQPFVDHVRTYKTLGGGRAVFKVVLYRGLVDKLEELCETVIRMASDCIDTFAVQPVLPLGHGYVNQDTVPSYRECQQANTVIERYVATAPIPVENAVFDHFTVRPNMWGRYGVIVNPEGEVYPLVEAVEQLQFMFNAMQFDSIRRSSLREIWESSEVMNMFRGLGWLQEPCSSCPVRKECRGGSRLNAYLVGRDIHGADPFCVLSPTHDSLMAMYQA